MPWSLKSVSYRMAGSGSWQYLLADKMSEQFYADMYPSGIELSKLDQTQKNLIDFWQEADIIKIEKGKAIPMGPIMTDADLVVLKTWFDDMTDTMCAAIKKNLDAYHIQARKMAGNSDSVEFQNILTIMICAHTLDSMVFSQLRKTVMGSYVARGSVGRFYFWGYAFSDGPKRIFGFTSYGAQATLSIHVLRSHGLDRGKLKQVIRDRDALEFLYENYIDSMPAAKPAADSRVLKKDKKLVEKLIDVHLVSEKAPDHLSIPVFHKDTMHQVSELYFKPSTLITKHFMEKMDELGGLVKQCSFARCPSADVLCMLFHLAYSYAADALVKEGVIWDFPESATGEWGVWVH